MELQVGECRITRIGEGIDSLVPLQVLLPELDTALRDRHLDWLAPSHYDPSTGMAILSIHSWVLETAHHKVLIDSCVGNHKERPRPETAEFHRLESGYLQRLAAAGLRPQDIDIVLCTHLHVDHVGWNTRLADGRWVPTFPRARYLFARREFDFWAGLKEEHPNQGVFEDSVLPIAEAGLMKLLDGEFEIETGLLVRPAPGHTPGHVVLQLESAGRRALFSGDTMHSALQVYAPQCNSCFCEDAQQARRTRRELLEELSDTSTLMLPVHFGAPYVGRVRSAPEGFSFEFLQA